MFGEMVRWKEWASPMPDDAAQLTTPSLQQLMLANGGIKSARAYDDEAHGLKTLLSTTFTPHMDLNQSWCRRSRPPPRAFGAIFAGNDTDGQMSELAWPQARPAFAHAHTARRHVHKQIT